MYYYFLTNNLIWHLWTPYDGHKLLSTRFCIKNINKYNIVKTKIYSEHRKIQWGPLSSWRLNKNKNKVFNSKKIYKKMYSIKACFTLFDNADLLKRFAIINTFYNNSRKKFHLYCIN
jgi:hypothetical protein